jgi:hypothetical protein
VFFLAVQTVQVTINEQNYSLTYNSTSGNWEGTITAPSITSYNVNDDHYYPVTLKATDDAGNTTTVDDSDSNLGSSLQLVVKETTAPTIEITSPSSSAMVLTATPTITFELQDETDGSGVNISTLSLAIDGETVAGNGSTGMTTESESGVYTCSYVVQSTLGEGEHTITIDAEDNDGNAATQASSTFTVDTVPPALNISSPTDSLITNSSSCTVAGTTSDTTSSGVTVTITLDGVDQGTVTVTDNAFSEAIILAEGTNTIVIRSTDSAGQYTEITRTVTLDTQAPTISAVTIESNPTDCGTTFVISVTVSD